MDNNKRRCEKCHEGHILVRRALSREWSYNALQAILREVLMYCLIMFSLWLCCFLFAHNESILPIFAVVAFGVSLILVPAWWFMRIVPLRQQKKHHFKCSHCGYTWDE